MLSTGVLQLHGHCVARLKPLGYSDVTSVFEWATIYVHLS